MHVVGLGRWKHQSRRSSGAPHQALIKRGVFPDLSSLADSRAVAVDLSARSHAMTEGSSMPLNDRLQQLVVITLKISATEGSGGN